MTTTTPRRKRGRNVRPKDKAPSTDVRLLERAIAATKDDAGEPITRYAFAEKYLLCDRRTLRKYAAGRRLPKLARQKCLELLGEVE